MVLTADVRAIAVESLAMECAVSQHFAMAASEGLQRNQAGGVELRFLVTRRQDGEEVEWSRSEKDAFLRCVDRSLERLSPTLDPRQYLSDQQYPQFSGNAVTFQVRALGFEKEIPPTAWRRWPLYFAEGVASEPSAPRCAAERDDQDEQDDLWESVRGIGRKCASHRDSDDEGPDEGSRDSALVEEESKASPQSTAASDAALRSLVQRLRWRAARWVPEFLLNDWNRGADNHSDVLQAAQRLPNRRFLHADARGIECDLWLLCHTVRYAYVGARQPDQRWMLVARIPVPAYLGKGSDRTLPHSTSRKRSRQTDLPYSNAAQVFFHDNASECIVLPPSEQRLVGLCAHVVAVEYTEKGRSLVLEDVAVQSIHECGDVSKAFSVEAVVDLVQASCRRFRKKTASMLKSKEMDGKQSSFADKEEGSSPGMLEGQPLRFAVAQQAWKVIENMSDSSSVHYKRFRSAGSRLVPTIRTCRDVALLSEGACVEFKHTLTSGEDSRAALPQHRSKATFDRLRHTLASMANTLGGCVLIGVGDDGTVSGHEPNEVSSRVRLTGFIPAMVKGAVSVRELPASTMSSLNPQWWRTSAVVTEEKPSTKRVFSVITVERGSAPYYSASRLARPYQRGFASTTSMSLWVMALRVYLSLSES